MGCSGSKPADTPRALTDIEAKLSEVPADAANTPIPQKQATPQRTAPLTPASAADANKEDRFPTPPAAASPPAPAVALALAPAPADVPIVDWSAVDWRERLTAEEYKVLREQKTEAAGTGEYDRFYPPEGHFICRGCGNPLFSAASKFKSGCGWPSFDRCYANSIILQADSTHGMQRRELVCARCKGHLGHLFSGEHLTPIDQRHCVNSLSIKFVKGPPPAGTVENSAGLDTTVVDRELDRAPGGGGASSSGMASVVPKSDLDLNDADLAAGWAATRALDRGWCVCSYAENSKVKLIMIAKGDNGFDELRALLKTRQESVSYCVAPVTVDGRQRFVFLCYIGESTSGIKRGRAAMHSPHVEKYFDGTVGSFAALTSSDELETEHVNRLLQQLCKGAKEAVVR